MYIHICIYIYKNVCRYVSLSLSLFRLVYCLTEPILRGAPTRPPASPAPCATRLGLNRTGPGAHASMSLGFICTPTCICIHVYIHVYVYVHVSMFKICIGFAWTHTRCVPGVDGVIPGDLRTAYDVSLLRCTVLGA